MAPDGPASDSEIDVLQPDPCAEIRIAVEYGMPGRNAVCTYLNSVNIVELTDVVYQEAIRGLYVSCLAAPIGF
jgi:hypothetical protein